MEIIVPKKFIYNRICSVCHQEFTTNLKYDYTCDKITCHSIQWRREYKLKLKKQRENYERRYPEYCERIRRKMNSRPSRGLWDIYVINLISNSFDLPREMIKSHPEFIESYRNQIKLKRILKRIKNETKKTTKPEGVICHNG